MIYFDSDYMEGAHPEVMVDNLRENGVSFEDWGIRGEKETTVRFVTSWATTEEDVEELVGD